MPRATYAFCVKSRIASLFALRDATLLLDASAAAKKQSRAHRVAAALRVCHKRRALVRVLAHIGAACDTIALPLHLQLRARSISVRTVAASFA